MSVLGPETLPEDILVWKIVEDILARGAQHVIAPVCYTKATTFEPAEGDPR